MKTYLVGKEKKENSFEKIYEIVRQIPAGKVATYGQIAQPERGGFGGLCLRGREPAD